MDSIEEVERKLKRYNQEHLLDYYNKMQDGELKKQFGEQLARIDYELIDNLYKNTAKSNQKNDVTVEPIEYWDKERLGGKYDFYEEIGLEAIKNGKLAAVTMAGGQGTRLGWKGPKGTFKLDIGKNGKYIFEILEENLEKSRKMYNILPYWYIMTSNQNNDETIAFFEKNNYFGYDKEKVKFFIQGELPILTKDGEEVKI